MKVIAAYISVVLLWSTTPLAIKWSNESFTFMAGVSLRMALACVLALIILALLRKPLFLFSKHWPVYAVASLGLFPAMPMVYWSAQFISSGMLALVFSMTPIATGLMTIIILRENPFTKVKFMGLLLAIAGLLVIFYEQVALYENAAFGILGALGACSVMGGSSVWLKYLSEQSLLEKASFTDGEDVASGENSAEAGSLEKTAGALVFAVPPLLLTWFMLGEPWPQGVSDKSYYSMAYLTVFGSLLGFTFYYFLLRNISPISLSLVTLMTPVLSLLLGNIIDGELVSSRLLFGAGMIVVALGVYQGVSPLKLYYWVTSRKQN